MTPEERAEFLKTHRFCVVGYGRKAGPPSLSPVYYVMDGDDLLISTQANRAKAKAALRDPRMTVCVLGEQPPFPYVTIYGRAAIEESGAVDLMAKLGEVISGQPVPPAARPALEERARNEQRVVLRFTPESFFETSPRPRPAAQG